MRTSAAHGPHFVRCERGPHPTAPAVDRDADQENRKRERTGEGTVDQQRARRAEEADQQPISMWPTGRRAEAETQTPTARPRCSFGTASWISVCCRTSNAPAQMPVTSSAAAASQRRADPTPEREAVDDEAAPSNGSRRTRRGKSERRRTAIVPPIARGIQRAEPSEPRAAHPARRSAGRCRREGEDSQAIPARSSPDRGDIDDQPRGTRAGRPNGGSAAAPCAGPPRRGAWTPGRRDSSGSPRSPGSSAPPRRRG